MSVYGVCTVPEECSPDGAKLRGPSGRPEKVGTRNGPQAPIGFLASVVSYFSVLPD